MTEISLGPRAAAAGYRVLTFERVGSTNAEALANVGEDRLWVVARDQSAGRGRRGRGWTSCDGNLYASLLLQSPAPAQTCATLALVSALAIHDAVAPIPARIKWPNDLLLHGQKFAGILLEAGLGGALAVGMGINCAAHPSGTDYPATDLGGAVTRERLFARLSDCMCQRLDQWQSGMTSIRRDWLERASGVGEDVRVQLPTRTLIGTFEDLDEDGRLLLRVPDGSLTPISAGDVFPLAPQRIDG